MVFIQQVTYSEALLLLYPCYNLLLFCKPPGGLQSHHVPSHSDITIAHVSLHVTKSLSPVQISPTSRMFPEGQNNLLEC